MVLTTLAAICIYQATRFQRALEDIESRGGAVSVPKGWGDSSSDAVCFYLPGVPPKLVDSDTSAIIADLELFKSLKVVDIRGTQATFELANAIVNRFPHVEVYIDKRQAETSVREVPVGPNARIMVLDH